MRKPGPGRRNIDDRPYLYFDDTIYWKLIEFNSDDVYEVANDFA